MPAPPTTPRRSIGRRLRGAALHGWRRLFPPAVGLDPPLRQLTATLLPNLDLGRVSVHRGMPHLLAYLAHDGITLPHPWAPGRIRVYLARRAWDYSRQDFVRILLHEALHAQQAQDWMRGWSVGPLRPFITLYLACWAGNRFRYAGHPMERDAYAFAGSRRSRFERWLAREQAHPALERCLAGGDALATGELRELEELCTPLVRARSAVAGGPQLAASFPGLAWSAQRLRQGLESTPLAWLLAAPAALVAVPAVALWALAWGLVSALLWLLQVVVELVGACVLGLPWLAGWLLERLERLLPGRPGLGRPGFDRDGLD